MENYLIIIEKNKNNYSAFSPDVPGCVATGKSIKEVKENMKSALEFHLEGLKLEKLPLPKASTNFYFNGSNKMDDIINFRCTKSLHKKLLKLAEKENVSVSHLVNDAIVKAYA